MFHNTLRYAAFRDVVLDVWNPDCAMPKVGSRSGLTLAELELTTCTRLTWLLTLNLA